MTISQARLNVKLSRRAALRRAAMLSAAALAWPLAACGDEDGEPTANTDTGEPTASAPSGVDATETSTPTQPPVPPNATPTMAGSSASDPTVTDVPPTATTTPPDIASATPTLPVMHQTWRQLVSTAASPAARRDHSLAANGEGTLAYLFGGRGAAGPLGDLWVYDVTANTWNERTPAGEQPAARFGHNAAFDPVSGRLLVFGGQAGATFFGDLWAYDPSADSWTLLAPDGAGPAPRYGAAGAFDPASGTLYISHGFTNQGRFDDTWAFGREDGTWLDMSPTEGARPEPRCLVRMVVDGAGQRLLLFGGQSNSTPFLDDLWTFTIESRTWQQLDVARPSARNLYALTNAGDQSVSVLYGGAGAEGFWDDIWRYGADTGAWQPVLVEGGSPPPRSGHDMTWLPAAQRALVFGGRGPDGDLNDLWELTLP